MKLINLNNAAMTLLLHSFLIPIGMIAAYFIPTTEDPTSLCILSLYNLKSQNHSTAELQSWLNFLESPHEEILVGKDTLSDTLDENKALRKLDFFSNVAASDHVDYLADRISASEVEGLPYCWRITLKDATREEATTVLEALQIVQGRKFLDQAAAYDPPIDVPNYEYGGVLFYHHPDVYGKRSSVAAKIRRPPRPRFGDVPSIESRPLAAYYSDWERPVPLNRSVQFGKACVPAVGALLAAILVVVAWSFCMPGQRNVPFASSVSLLLASTFMLSFVGAGFGYLLTANSDAEWESEMSVELRRIPFSTVEDLTSETKSLTAKLNQKLEIGNRFSHIKNKEWIKRCVESKRMTTWSSFQPIAKARGFDNQVDVAGNLDRLCDYIMDRLEIEQAPDAGNIYTLRFRCEDPDDSRGVLACLVDDYCADHDRFNKKVGLGGQLTRKYEIHRSNTEIRKLRWPGIASGHTLQGALAPFFL